MTGRTYLLHGQLVTVLAAGGGRSRGGLPGSARTVRSPRNVLIQHSDGTRVVRPFRGLRKALPEVGQ